MTNDELSLQYHSIRFYNGKYSRKNVNYRIGNTTTVISDEIEKFYDTWIDFHLIPSERPTVAVPPAVTKVVAVPGRETAIDFSDFLTGHPTYGNRSGSWSFITDTDYVNSQGGWISFENRLKQIFHGHVYKVVLVDDPSYFYVGEITLGQWQTGNSYSGITMTYSLYPYKKDMVSSMDMWKWDDFDFKNGTISYTKDLDISGSRTIKIIGSPERISPHISGSSGLTIKKQENGSWVNYGDVPTAAITSNKSIIPRFVIEEGINNIRVQGTGTITIDYRRGLL